MFVSNGAEMLRGRSAYVASLSGRERAALRFILAEDSAKKSLEFPHQVMQSMGAALVIAGIAVLALAVYELLIRNPDLVDLWNTL